MDNRFIVALDQSGGSVYDALSNYGINNFNDNLFDTMHDFRKRIVKSKCFNSDRIYGVILPYDEISSEIDGVNFVKFLNDKGIVVFVKIDNGLLKEENGVCMMKDIHNVDDTLEELKKTFVYGTKMRSLIVKNERKGIKNIVKQQFELAKKICSYGLVPIVEPEVSIYSSEKCDCEILLKDEISKQLKLLENEKIILKLTIPTIDGLYDELFESNSVLKLTCLSGGYSRREAVWKISRNRNITACFSRAFLEGLNVSQSDEEFESTLDKIINNIYRRKI